MSGVVAPPPVPPPPPVFAYDGSADAAMIAIWDAQRRQAFIAAATGTGTAFVPPSPTILTQAVIIPETKTHEGWLISAVDSAWLAIVRLISQNPALMYEIDWRKWEEIIAGSWKKMGFDEVTLTPPSNDKGRDVIAVKRGFGSVRFIESVKAFAPHRRVEADDVRALIGVLVTDRNATKGIVTTTSDFAPMIGTDPSIQPYIPHRLELVNGINLIARLKKIAEQT